MLGGIVDTFLAHVWHIFWHIFGTFLTHFWHIFWHIFDTFLTHFWYTFWHMFGTFLVCSVRITKPGIIRYQTKTKTYASMQGTGVILCTFILGTFVSGFMLGTGLYCIWVYIVYVFMLRNTNVVRVSIPMYNVFICVLL